MWVFQAAGVPVPVCFCDPGSSRGHRPSTALGSLNTAPSQKSSIDSKVVRFNCLTFVPVSGKPVIPQFNRSDGVAQQPAYQFLPAKTNTGQSVSVLVESGDLCAGPLDSFTLQLAVVCLS